MLVANTVPISKVPHSIVCDELVLEHLREHLRIDDACEAERLCHLHLAGLIQSDLLGKLIEDILAEVVILDDDNAILDGENLTSARIAAHFAPTLANNVSFILPVCPAFT